MALDYLLELSTELSASEVRQRILALLGHSVMEVEPGEVPRIAAPGVIIAVFDLDKGSRKIIKRDYDLNATICVSFRLDKFEQYDRAVTAAMQVSLELLRTTNSDGILNFNDRSDVLRRNGKLILDPEAAQWNHACELAQEPYVLAPIPKNQLV